ncbi:MAG: twin-arginine translocase TatA/TatE family subunit [Gemmatimonadota bacterium]
MGLQNFGFTEIMIILVIVLLLFGAKRIPEIAGSLGKGITEFKRNLSDAQKSITEPATRNETRVAAGSPLEKPVEEERPEPKRLLN